MLVGERARFVCSAALASGTEKLIKVLREQAFKHTHAHILTHAPWRPGAELRYDWQAKTRHNKSAAGVAEKNGIATGGADDDDPCAGSFCNCSMALQKMYEDNPDLLQMGGKTMEFEFEMQEYMPPGTFEQVDPVHAPPLVLIVTRRTGSLGTLREGAI